MQAYALHGVESQTGEIVCSLAIILLQNGWQKGILIPTVRIKSVANVNSRTLAKMGKGENVSMEILGRICQALDCKIEDIVCYIPDEQ